MLKRDENKKIESIIQLSIEYFHFMIILIEFKVFHDEHCYLLLESHLHPGCQL